MYFSDETCQASRKLTEQWQANVRQTPATKPDWKNRFSTVSDLDIKRLYTPEDLQSMDFARDIGAPGEFPIFAATRSPATADSPGLSECSPAWEAPRTPTPAGICSCGRDRPAFPPPSTFPRSWGMTATRPRPWARSANAAWPSTAWRIFWR